MPKRTLTFVGTGQAYPAKRDTADRKHDFREIARAYAIEKAEEQSSRCSQCGVPYCSVHCPLHNHIPDWLKLTAEGRLREAYELSNATSTMPEICGRICPQDRLCEGNCVIEFSGHGAVTIGAIEKFITDTAWAEGWVEPIVPMRDRSDQSVGIVGAGPAGLTATEYMRGHGYDVHVYDRHDRMGGLLTYGIPNFKLEKEVVMRRVERLRESGIHFHENFEVGRDASLAELRANHDAMLIATGVYKARELKAPGVGAPGVVEALDYLIASNRKGFGEEVEAFDSGVLDARGRHVVVVGGGDTAMDCVRTAVRQGAKSVKCLYRRDRDNMPGSQNEVRNAEDLPGLFGSPDLSVTRWGTLRIDHRTMQTSLDGVFAAGDIVRGASLVVWAIRDGRDVAGHMHAYLKAKASAQTGEPQRSAAATAAA